MLLCLAAAFFVAVGPQASSPDRAHAERLARGGQAEEAIRLYAQIVDDHPEDIEARLWVARLALRLGRTADAEAALRAVLDRRPGDVDARIGMGIVLTRRGAWEAAVQVLRGTERTAGANADLLSALARAYRRGGDDRRALEYFARARALAPDDPDVASGYEAAARLHGHSVGVEGFWEGGPAVDSAASGSAILDVRVVPALRLQATIRLQTRVDVADVIAGGGLSWRVARATVVSARAAGGRGNTSLPTGDVAADLVHYAGIVELGGSVRQMAFTGAAVTAASPTAALDPGGRWRLDTRYTYSYSRFAETGEAIGDHSVLIRPTWRAWPRVSIHGAYAYGIERFESLTADRIGALGTTTVAGGLQIRLPSLTTLTVSGEQQWRSNDTAPVRITVALVQSWP